MSRLGGQVEDYLRLRRALGFKMERAGRILPQFVAYLEAAGAATVTSDLAIAWARLPGRAQPNHWAQQWPSPAASPGTCRPSTRQRRSHLVACSPPAGTGPRPSCGRNATSVACSRAHERCAQPYERRPTKRCSGCSLRSEHRDVRTNQAFGVVDW
jgi:hypothetical protein